MKAGNSSDSSLEPLECINDLKQSSSKGTFRSSFTTEQPKQKDSQRPAVETDQQKSILTRPDQPESTVEMPPPSKQQEAFGGHPIKCPSCYSMIYVSCQKCKGFGKVQLHHQQAAATRTLRSVAGRKEPGNATPETTRKNGTGNPKKPM